LAKVFIAPTHPRKGEPGRLFLNLSEHGRLRAIGLARAKIRQRTGGGVLGPRICSTIATLRPATVTSVPRGSIWSNRSHTNGRPLLYGKARLAGNSDARVQ
jgi:hypothetical protein